MGEDRQHVISTVHVGLLVRNAQRIVTACDGAGAGTITTVLAPARRVGDEDVAVEDALAKAAADLRRAADELEAERLSCLGWPQV